MYAKLYQTRYGGVPAQVAKIDNINKLTMIANKHGGTLECGFCQGYEDFNTGVLSSHDLIKDGVCFGLVLMWLRMKFEEKPDSDFHAWLFARDVRGRNAKMATWMENQLMATDLGDPELARVYSKVMTKQKHEAVREKFKAAYPKGGFPAYLNYANETGTRKAPLDRSYDPEDYAGTQQRARYVLATEALGYKFKQLSSRMGRLRIWQEAEISQRDGYVLQLVASKITKSATKANRLSMKDRIVSVRLRASYKSGEDKDGLEKREEAARLIVDAMLKYKKELKNEDAFVIISIPGHAMGVFFSRSPLMGHGVLSFFDPNHGIWRFETTSLADRFEHFYRFFDAFTCVYPDMDSFLITILSRH
ncbi:hypothetical protein JYJ95_35030 [Corallococcus exiguus]|uniref:hypothetical protein n=1 Tax=Corallococcus exiguus TaxID=83462 RepID=UPI001A8D156A|nr:hypothetical protein [Corallococcus exiguus]MBN8471751.1 hypothetical protein [Corallococcus exiguus]